MFAIHLFRSFINRLIPEKKINIWWFIWLIIVYILGFFLLTSFRNLSLYVYIYIVYTLSSRSYQGHITKLILLIVLYIGLLCLPFDVIPINYPGPPKIVPYVIGYPDRSMIEDAIAGKIVLHGCVVTGQEPKWVMVW